MNQIDPKKIKLTDPNNFQDPKARPVGLDYRSTSSNLPKGYKNLDVYYGNLPSELTADDIANMQSKWAKRGNALGQTLTTVVGDTVSGFGYLFEIGNVTESLANDSHNFLVELGNRISEGGRELMPVYATRAAQEGFRPFDGDWWALNAPSIGSAISLLIPARASTFLLGKIGKAVTQTSSIAKRRALIAKARELGVDVKKYAAKQKMIPEALSQAVLSRHMENMMEATGNFDSTYQELKASGYSEEEARKIAGKAAVENYQQGYWALMTDVPQYLLLAGFKLPKFNVSNKALDKVIDYGGAMAGEGFEEMLQYAISEHSKEKALLGDEYTSNIAQQLYKKGLDPESLTSGFFGAIGGGVFNSLGKKSEDLKSILESDDPASAAAESLARRAANDSNVAADLEELEESANSPDSEIPGSAQERISAVNTAVRNAQEQNEGLETSPEELANQASRNNSIAQIEKNQKGIDRALNSIDTDYKNEPEKANYFKKKLQQKITETKLNKLREKESTPEVNRLIKKYEKVLEKLNAEINEINLEELGVSEEMEIPYERSTLQRAGFQINHEIAYEATLNGQVEENTNLEEPPVTEEQPTSTEQQPGQQIEPETTPGQEQAEVTPEEEITPEEQVPSTEGQNQTRYNEIEKRIDNIEGDVLLTAYDTLKNDTAENLGLTQEQQDRLVEKAKNKLIQLGLYTEKGRLRRGTIANTDYEVTDSGIFYKQEKIPNPNNLTEFDLLNEHYAQNDGAKLRQEEQENAEGERRLKRKILKKIEGELIRFLESKQTPNETSYVGTIRENPEQEDSYIFEDSNGEQRILGIDDFSLNDIQLLKEVKIPKKVIKGKEKIIKYLKKHLKNRFYTYGKSSMIRIFEERSFRNSNMEASLSDEFDANKLSVYEERNDALARELKKAFLTVAINDTHKYRREKKDRKNVINVFTATKRKLENYLNLVQLGFSSKVDVTKIIRSSEDPYRNFEYLIEEQVPASEQVQQEQEQEQLNLEERYKKAHDKFVQGVKILLRENNFNHQEEVPADVLEEYIRNNQMEFIELSVELSEEYTNTPEGIEAFIQNEIVKQNALHEAYLKKLEVEGVELEESKTTSGNTTEQQTQEQEEQEQEEEQKRKEKESENKTKENDEEFIKNELEKKGITLGETPLLLSTKANGGEWLAVDARLNKKGNPVLDLVKLEEDGKTRKKSGILLSNVEKQTIIFDTEAIENENPTEQNPSVPINNDENENDGSDQSKIEDLEIFEENGTEPADLIQTPEGVFFKIVVKDGGTTFNLSDIKFGNVTEEQEKRLLREIIKNRSDFNLKITNSWTPLESRTRGSIMSEIPNPRFNYEKINDLKVVPGETEVSFVIDPQDNFNQGKTDQGKDVKVTKDNFKVYIMIDGQPVGILKSSEKGRFYVGAKELTALREALWQEYQSRNSTSEYTSEYTTTVSRSYAPRPKRKAKNEFDANSNEKLFVAISSNTVSSGSEHVEVRGFTPGAIYKQVSFNGKKFFYRLFTKPFSKEDTTKIGIDKIKTLFPTLVSGLRNANIELTDMTYYEVMYNILNLANTNSEFFKENVSELKEEARSIVFFSKKDKKGNFGPDFRENLAELNTTLYLNKNGEFDPDLYIKFEGLLGRPLQVKKKLLNDGDYNSLIADRLIDDYDGFHSIRFGIDLNNISLEKKAKTTPTTEKVPDTETDVTSVEKPIEQTTDSDSLLYDFSDVSTQALEQQLKEEKARKNPDLDYIKVLEQELTRRKEKDSKSSSKNDNANNVESDIPEDEDGDLPFRLKKEGDETANLEEEIAEFRRIVGNYPIEVIERIVNKYGKEAWGVFTGAAVKFSKRIGKKTGRHEAFHVVFDLLTDEQKQVLYSEYRNKPGNKNKSEYDLEEAIADDFMEFHDYQVDTGLKAKVKKIFQKIVDFIKFLLNMPMESKQLFRVMDRGLYQKRAEKSVKQEKTLKYKVPDEFSSSEELYARVNDTVIVFFKYAKRVYRKYLEDTYPEKSAPEIIKMMNNRADAISYVLSKGDVVNEKGFGKNSAFTQALIKMLENRLSNPKFEVDTASVNAYISALSSGSMTPFLYRELMSYGLVPSSRSAYLIFGVTEEQLPEELQEESNVKEGWQNSIGDISQKENLSQRLRIAIGFIPKKELVIDEETGEEKYVSTRNEVGGINYYSPNEAYSTILERIGNSTSVEDMLKKINSIPIHSIRVALKQYLQDENSNIKTDLWVSIGQNVRPVSLEVIGEDSGYNLKRSDTHTLRNNVLSSFIAVKNPKKLSNLASLNPSELMITLRENGIMFPPEVIDLLAGGKTQRSREILKRIEEFDYNYDSYNQSFQIIVEQVQPFFPKTFQSAHYSVKGERVYSWIRSSYVGRLVNKIKNGEITNATYANNPLLKNSLILKSGRHIDFVTIGGIKHSGKRKGNTYNKMSEKELLLTQLAGWKENIFFSPILSDSPNLIGISFPGPGKAMNFTASLATLEGLAIKEIEQIEQLESYIKEIEAKIEEGGLTKENAPQMYRILTEMKSFSKKWNQSAYFEGATKENAYTVVKEMVEEETKKLFIRYSELGLIQEESKGVFRTTYDSTEGLGNIYKDIRKNVIKDIAFRIEFINLAIGHPAQYKNPEDFYKRAKQIWSPGTYLDTSVMDQKTYNVEYEESIIKRNVGKVVFGHPTIGKSYLKDKNADDFISLDDDYADEVNAMVNEIAKKYSVERSQVKDGGNEAWNQEYNNGMQALFERGVAQAMQENKVFFTSNTNLLVQNKDVFDKVINIPDDVFKKRAEERGVKYDINEWKEQINNAISEIAPEKVITTDKYLADIIEEIQDYSENYKFLKDLLKDSPRRDEILSLYNEIDTTDAQSYIDLFSHLQRLKGLNRNNYYIEKAIDWLMQGKTAYDLDLSIAENVEIKKVLLKDFQPWKPFYYSKHDAVTGDTSFDYEFSVQNKDSEALLIPAYADVRKDFYNPKHKARLERMGYFFYYKNAKTGEDVTYEEAEQNPDNVEFIVEFDKEGRINGEYTDKFTFNSALKVGMFGVGDGTRHQFSYDDWRLQQETPSHHVDTRQGFGTQITKLFSADIDDSDKTLVKEFNDLMKSDIKEDAENFRARFYDEQGKFQFKKFVELLRQEVIERKLGEEYLDMLEIDENGETRLPLWFPTQASRIEAMMFSMYRSNITRRYFEQNGVSFINLASDGFRKKLKIKKNDRGEAVYEIMVPPHSKKFFSPEFTTNGYPDIEKIKKKDPSLLEGIMYRIPTEGKYSMFNVEIVGFLPPSAGGQIAMPEEITAIAGLDFDVDKVFGFFKSSEKLEDQTSKEVRQIQRSYQTRLSRLYKQKERIYNNDRAFFKDFDVYEKTEKELIEQYKKINLEAELVKESIKEDDRYMRTLLLDDAAKIYSVYDMDVETEIQRLKDKLKKDRDYLEELNQKMQDIREQDANLANALPSKAEVAEHAKASKEKYAKVDAEIEKVKGYIAEETKPYREKKLKRVKSDNRKIEIIQAVIGKYVEQSFKAGSFARMESTNREIRFLEQKPVNEETGQPYSWEEFSSLSEKQQDDILSAADKLTYFLPSDQVRVASRMNTGGTIVGISANNLVAHAMMLEGNVKLFEPLNIGGKIYSSLSRKFDDAGVPVTENFSEYVAASVDNGKNPQVEYFNLNELTHPVAFALQHLGFTLPNAMMFLSQPILKQLSREYFNGGASYSAIEVAFTNVYNEHIAGKEGDAMVPDSSVLTMERLRSNLENNVFDPQVYYLFKKLYEGVAERLSDLVIVLKDGDVGLGPDQFTTHEKVTRTLVYKSKSRSLDILQNSQDLLENDHYMNTLYKIGMRDAYKEITTNLKYPTLSSGHFASVLMSVQTRLGGNISIETKKLIYNEYLRYLATKANLFRNLNVDGVPLKVLNLKKKYPNNKFLQRIDIKLIKRNGKDYPIIEFTGTIGADAAEIGKIKSSFRDLLIKEKEDMMDLVRYSFARDGFSSSIKGYSKFIPAVEVYTETLEGQLFLEVFKNEVLNANLETDEAAKIANQIIGHNFPKIQEISFMTAKERRTLKADRFSPRYKKYINVRPATSNKKGSNIVELYKSDGDKYILQKKPGIWNYQNLLLADYNAESVRSSLVFLPKTNIRVEPKMKADKNAKAKASVATQFIGFGPTSVFSSTELYRSQNAKYANTGAYSSSDVIFVSVPGRGRGGVDTKPYQDKTIKEAIKAVEAGATILTDPLDYTKSSNYNTGEKRLYQNMESKGFYYGEEIIQGQKIGYWKLKPEEKDKRTNSVSPNLDNTYISEEEASYTSTQEVEPAVSMSMYFEYGNSKNPNFESENTFDAVVNGERTSTLRKRSFYKTEEQWEKLKSLKRGDIIEISSQKNMKGKKAFVRLTQDASLFEKGFEVSPEILKGFSETEGWSVKHLTDRGYAKMSEDTIRLTFEYVQPTESQEANPTAELESLIETQGEIVYDELDGETLADYVSTLRLSGVEDSVILDNLKNCKGFGRKGGLKAATGLQTGFTKGGRWNIVKEFKGNSHAQGGIDISIGKDGIKLQNGQEDFKAKKGLVLPGINSKFKDLTYYAKNGLTVPNTDPSIYNGGMMPVTEVIAEAPFWLRYKKEKR